MGGRKNENFPTFFYIYKSQIFFPWATLDPSASSIYFRNIYLPKAITKILEIPNNLPLIKYYFRNNQN